MSEAKSASGGQKSAIEDILLAFRIFESSNIKSSYYELNISCPNLYGNITFYPPKNLDELLSAVDKIKLGASLIQLITGLIFEGPLLVAKINNELPKLLKNDGFKNISEAIGTEN